MNRNNAAKRKTRLLGVLLALALLCAELCCPPAVARAAERSAAAPGVTAAAAIPERQWQKTAAFPDWKGYTDDTLAMNSMVSFRFWHGQGTLWLRVSEEVDSFSLYVNGVRFDTAAVGAGVWAVDFSAAAQNGMNTLQISNILPLGIKNAVTAYIPYPTVLAARGRRQARVVLRHTGALRYDRASGLDGDACDDRPLTRAGGRVSHQQNQFADH